MASQRTGPRDTGTIALAVFRPRREYLERQLSSIREQTCATWTCLIGIDGDDTEAHDLVRELTADDPRFIVHHFEDNVGFYRNFERLIALADPSTPWIALSDQDDDWDPEKLAVLVQALDDTEALLATCQARVVDGAGREIGTTNRRHVDTISLLINNQITGSLAVFRPVIARVGLPFPEPTRAAYHDHWLGLVAATTGDWVLVDRCLQSYIQHGNNVLGEELGGMWKTRIARLARDGTAGAVDQLVVDRWGWRQRMAREVLDRVGAMSAPTAVQDIAEGTVTLAVGRALVRAVRHRDVPASRAASLLVGAVLARSGIGRRRDPGR